MKVLWFTNTPSLYQNEEKHSYHGGGWISSLQKLISKEDKIKLAISFFHENDNGKKIQGDITYYPILKVKGSKKPIETTINNWKGKISQRKYLSNIIEIVADFQPDIIHVFGTENIFGRVQDHFDIPVVIHMQGLINPYLNAYYPPGISPLSFYFNWKNFIDHLLGRSVPFAFKKFKDRAKNEKEILNNVKYVMGRTHWDKMVSELYNPAVNYYHINEVLRPCFYDHQKIKYDTTSNGKLIITSTISSTIYKGIDLILKTAKFLTEEVKIDFSWNLIGLDENDMFANHFKKKLNIEYGKIGIKFLGVKEENELLQNLSRSHLFVHPSYIDNSPNSICEAQMIGLPVIACDVGGVSSLISNGETGYLIPSNGVHELASKIIFLYKNKKLLKTMGFKARDQAIIRHDKQVILKSIISCYDQILTIHD